VTPLFATVYTTMYLTDRSRRVSSGWRIVEVFWCFLPLRFYFLCKVQSPTHFDRFHNRPPGTQKITGQTGGEVI